MHRILTEIQNTSYYTVPAETQASGVAQSLRKVHTGGLFYVKILFSTSERRRKNRSIFLNLFFARSTRPECIHELQTQEKSEI